MISHHPYNTWPLHVKLFSDEAVGAWKAATRSSASMPPGFTCTTETEGVDGKSGKVGSGRQGPIKVKDGNEQILVLQIELLLISSISEHFTSTYLAKNTALLAANPSLCCSVCNEEILNYTSDALSTALCPNTSCSAVSHLTCLSTKFLGPSTVLIPRGGTCPSCKTYILWGDIVRGSYRRQTGGISTEPDAVDDDLFDAAEEGELYDSSNETSPMKKPKKVKKKASAPSVRKPRRTQKTVVTSSEGEHFEFGTDSSAAETPTKRRGRPTKKSSQLIDTPVSSRINLGAASSVAAEPTKKRLGRPPKKPLQSVDIPGSSSEGEHFDFDTGTAAAEIPKKRRGCPKKSSQTIDVPTSSIAEDNLFDSDDSSEASPRRKYSKRSQPLATSSSLEAYKPDTTPRKRGRPPKNPSTAFHYSTVAASDSSGESFDFRDIGGESSAEEDVLQCTPGLSTLSHPPSKPIAKALETNIMGLVDTMSSLTLSSLPAPKPVCIPRYIEISD
ncbi:hypothetical protein H0H92_004509 [Tricholoma furcatifolium]|nr:hypothetical protein H0H92_004509 [Tricholoma furcatifolium]